MKRGGYVWLLRETKYQPDQPKAGTSSSESTPSHGGSSINPRRPLGRDLKENDAPVHDFVVLDIERQRGGHDVGFLREIHGGAIHALGCAWLIETGD